METRDISEFWISKTEGDRVKAEELVGKEILIIDFETRPSQFYENKDYAIIQIEQESVKKVLTTTAGAIIGSLKWLRDRGAFPGRVKCKIVKEASSKGRMMYKLAPTVEPLAAAMETLVERMGE